MKEVFLNIDKLNVEYVTDDAIVYALNDFSLKVEKGEKIGLVGETGAGKTTLAFSILRLLPQKVGKIVSGSINYCGDELLDKPESFMQGVRGRRISMIFQDPMTSLNPIKRVGDQVLEVLNLHFPNLTKKEKDTQVDEIFNLVGIPRARKVEYPHQFSGGMKQRIVIAMALIVEPELLIADEPTTALDVTIQAQILELMKDLKEKYNSAVIMITHDLGVVAEFCDSVAVVYGGRVVEIGSVEDIFGKKGNHPYTIGLINCIPDLSGTTPRLHPIPGHMADPRIKHTGCCFAGRCLRATEICHKMPPQMHYDGEHGVLCHYIDKEDK
ncbi:MAG: ABC transporter ATP-binding protein [Sphaerochaeta sp.]